MTEASRPDGLTRLNHWSTVEARAALLSCCGSREWARRMANERPFQDIEALLREAVRIWQDLGPDDRLEAFSAHPRIGEDPASSGESTRAARWSALEQTRAGEASSSLKQSLAEANRRYEARFGYVFLVCASGKSASEILDELEARLMHDPKHEIGVAAAEQQRITAMRLARLVADGSSEP
jgi:OHCU decarboxylase